MAFSKADDIRNPRANEDAYKNYHIISNNSLARATNVPATVFKEKPREDNGKGSQDK
jgi:hypothetical protein